jgi:hypothetical protein
VAFSNQAMADFFSPSLAQLCQRVKKTRKRLPYSDLTGIPEVEIGVAAVRSAYLISSFYLRIS